MTRSWFVTGTDTGVGKTLVTAALLRQLREAGVAVAGMKPVAAGAIAGPEGPANEDALLLQTESSVRHPYAIVNPCLFEPAIAPHIAAAEAGQAIDTERIVTAHQRLAAGAQVVLAEGAGVRRGCSSWPGELPTVGATPS
jgi:dethiobiotin synthetase